MTSNAPYYHCLFYDKTTVELAKHLEVPIWTATKVQRGMDAGLGCENVVDIDDTDVDIKKCSLD